MNYLKIACFFVAFIFIEAVFASRCNDLTLKAGDVNEPRFDTIKLADSVVPELKQFLRKRMHKQISTGGVSVVEIVSDDPNYKMYEAVYDIYSTPAGYQSELSSVCSVIIKVGVNDQSNVKVDKRRISCTI